MPFHGTGYLSYQAITMEEKHIFALFSAKPLSQNMQTGQEIVLKDAELSHRISRVLRIRPKDTVVLFDGKIATYITDCMVNKDFLTATVEKSLLASPITPEIHLYCGLVKKDALESIAYYTAQLGVHSITPLITQKSERSELNEKEKLRLKNIMIAGCEQAKQFWTPEIKDPVKLDTVLQKNHDFLNLFCEAEGKRLTRVLLEKKTVENIALFIGPEGGFTKEEQNLMNDHTFHCCSLTPTILRSQEATLVALGIIRNFYLID
jgi:16S rRNA (uracil1498-N3)-methyltransferase